MRAYFGWLLSAVLVMGLAFVGYRRAEHQIDDLARQCGAAAERSEWTRLESLSRQWIDKRAKAPAAWYWLGAALKNQARYEEAQRAFEQVPPDGMRGLDAAVERLEYTFHVMQRPLDAVASAEELLRRDPQLASPRRHLIYFYAMTLDRPRLLEQIHLAIQHRADLPEHYVYLLTLEDLSFRDAAEVTEKWTSAAPDSSFLQLISDVQRLRVARNLARQTPSPEFTQEYEGIRTRFLDAHSGDGEPPVVLDTLLLLAVDRDDTAEAARLLSLVPEAAAADPIFWRYRGWYAQRIGDQRQAQDSYLQALELHPLGWQSRHEYANLMRTIGDASSAAQTQSVAGLGTRLVLESRRWDHARSVNAQWLADLAKFASHCGEDQVANGVLRRQHSDDRSL